MSAARLQFVVGKGGVGKSTLTAALAIAAANRGQRVLALELGEPAGLARLLGARPSDPTETLPVREGLWLGFVAGDAALAEYLELIIPIRRLLSTVFASRIYRYFVAAAPGLKELMTIGKIWYEHEKKHPDGSRFWDRIVVDAGASGHSLQYLQMPSTAARTFGSGLVHRESLRVEGILKDPASTEIHVIAIPEEMPLVEAAEIVEQLNGGLGLPLGRVMINRCRAPAPPGVAGLLGRLEGSRLECVPEYGLVDPSTMAQGLGATAVSALAWERLQESGIDQLEKRIGRHVERLPFLATEEFGLEQVERLAVLLERGWLRPV